jgi:hypothetical protein
MVHLAPSQQAANSSETDTRDASPYDFSDARGVDHRRKLMKQRWLIALAGVVVLAVVGAGAVMAQEGGSDGSPSFLDRVAEKLGIDRAELDQAIDDARSDELDEAVAAGELTQEEADRLRERYEGSLDDDELLPRAFRDGPGGKGRDFHFRLGPPDGEHRGFGFGLPFAGLAGIDDEFAEFLGISVEQLREELQADDATIASVAEAHGKSRDDVKQFATEKAQERLDTAVENGRLTQEMADRMLDGLDMAIDAALDAPVGKFFGRFEWRSHEDPLGDGEDDTTPEQSGESRDTDRS